MVNVRACLNFTKIFCYSSFFVHFQSLFAKFILSLNSNSPLLSLCGRTNYPKNSSEN